MLLIMYINDMTRCVLKTNISLYADDSKLYNSVNSKTDCNHLQADINRCTRWCKQWKMKLNLNKCNLITFTNKKSFITKKYSINGKPINIVDSVKDLGVILSQNFNFSIHIGVIVNKAFKMLGLLKRTCSAFEDVRVFKSLYFSIVRSNLEYCSHVWSPSQKYLIAKLERVQIKFIKYLCYKAQIPFKTNMYLNLCKQFNIPTLESRRQVLDLIFLYKCINNYYDTSYILGEIHFHFPERVLRQNSYFKLGSYRINVRKFSFLPRVCAHFNNIIIDSDNSIDLCESLFKFKNKLQSIFYK